MAFQCNNATASLSSHVFDDDDDGDDFLLRVSIPDENVRRLPAGLMSISRLKDSNTNRALKRPFGDGKSAANVHANAVGAPVNKKGSFAEQLAVLEPASMVSGSTTDRTKSEFAKGTENQPKSDVEERCISGSLQTAMTFRRANSASPALYEIFTHVIGLREEKGQKVLMLRTGEQSCVQKALYFVLGERRFNVKTGDFVRCVGKFETNFGHKGENFRIMKIRTVDYKKAQAHALRLDAITKFVINNLKID